MNRTPRTLNRALLGLAGLVLLALGTGLILLSTDPAAARWWWNTGPALMADGGRVLADTAMPGQSQSWLWPLLALAMAVSVVLLVLWISAQGRGRVDTLVEEYDDDGAPGRIAISGAVPEQALRAALLQDPDVTSVAVSTWSLGRGGNGLRVRITPRQGAAPHLIAADATNLVDALDSALGRSSTVLISLDAGRRYRLGREERVR
ncbi:MULTISPECIES: hypothetical protein [Arthrobacter]|uniref:Alkaline shock response membrane anchor protein AmaP n=1 Tax=Arthrobacter caoxuetaonis TaxID=2886935 RepID=A0A9X1SDH5_9MICC|nr:MULTISPECIES: hypothetical protein [Arthrobacter]MCC3281625.1 hypothetical protein [Arthrobacter caoxuetaonis]MCC3298706.1 hypothetical protein [Arthrobacter caoxuetaonis]MCC9194932.1 hypothetical protein [Arthrobacter sp. zg-Y916]USQ57440.1 hypothetical protein NF551_00795 [Arthrobacter caoxuetaonis]